MCPTETGVRWLCCQQALICHYLYVDSYRLGEINLKTVTAPGCVHPPSTHPAMAQRNSHAEIRRHHHHSDVGMMASAGEAAEPPRSPQQPRCAIPPHPAASRLKLDPHFYCKAHAGGSTGSSLPAARLSPRSVCSALGAMRRQTRLCWEGQK